jgi:hypothetical protein
MEPILLVLNGIEIMVIDKLEVEETMGIMWDVDLMWNNKVAYIGGGTSLDVDRVQVAQILAELQ